MKSIAAERVIQFVRDFEGFVSLRGASVSRVCLVGGYRSGHVHPFSDLDLMCLTKDELSFEKEISLLSRIEEEARYWCEERGIRVFPKLDIAFVHRQSYERAAHPLLPNRPAIDALIEQKEIRAKARWVRERNLWHLLEALRTLLLNPTERAITKSGIAAILDLHYLALPLPEELGLSKQGIYQRLESSGKWLDEELRGEHLRLMTGVGPRPENTGKRIVAQVLRHLDRIDPEHESPGPLDVSWAQYTHYSRFRPRMVSQVKRVGNHFRLPDVWPTEIRTLALEIASCLPARSQRWFRELESQVSRTPRGVEYLELKKPVFGARDFHFNLVLKGTEFPVVKKFAEIGRLRKSLQARDSRLLIKCEQRIGPLLLPAMFVSSPQSFKKRVAQRNMTDLFQRLGQRRAPHGEWVECDLERAEALVYPSKDMGGSLKSFIGEIPEMSMAYVVLPAWLRQLKPQAAKPKWCFRLKAPFELRRDFIQDAVSKMRLGKVVEAGGNSDSVLLEMLSRGEGAGFIQELDIVDPDLSSFKKMASNQVRLHSRSILDFKLQEHEALVATEVLEHLSSAELDELVRLLRKARRVRQLIVTVPNQAYQVFPGVYPSHFDHKTAFDRESFTSFLRRLSGFKIVQFAELGGRDERGEPVSFGARLVRFPE